ncbi:hypothetical protein [Flavobacterium anhuiense]|uniref:hypothetical protein n=1 Tax=Flavobacterium anhuiense TaxID=459526 RepID=UPI003D9794AA
MTIADLIKDFIDSTKERLKTPISGAILWSFLIYNWRAIFLLIFSKASIEDKIIVINHEYCNFWAIFWPLVIATMYTLLIPKIMLLIDTDLAPTKNDRITMRYEIKKHEVIQKTNVAREEFILKSEESGNQTIQEFMSQIEALKENNNSLQESIKQVNESNKTNVDGLNNSLKSAQEALKAKDLEITKLKSLLESNYNNPKGLIEDIETTNFKRIISNEVASQPTIPQDVKTKILMIIDTMTLQDFHTLESIEKRGHEVLLNTVQSFSGVASLTDKSILVRRAIGNRLSFTFTEAGSIMHLILNKRFKLKKT